MTAFLKAADLTQKQFIELIANLQPNNVKQPGYVWLEAPDGWTFDCWNWTSELVVPEESINNEEPRVNALRWCGTGQESVAEKEPAYDCLTRSTAGRLFDATGELRWRTIPAPGQVCYRVVFLGNTDWVGTTLKDHSHSLKDLQPREDRFFLWGQQTETTPKEWIELRIPHRFRYPVPGDPNRIKIRVEQWRDSTGAIHFSRLCDLEPYEEEA
ncbi:MAG: hypothetical protein OXU36_14505 [Candidatus Poribacteria bacterium]|nr:hypothetical protein [Candidatus Poribacteria bacterium]